MDGIYPDWAIFVNTIKGDAANEEERKFASKQESVRKDIERAFGILVKQWQILDRTFRQWDKDEIAKILDCCIIMHNMAVEHRRQDYAMSERMHHDRQPHGAAAAAAQDGAAAQERPRVSLFGHSPTNDAHVIGPGRARLRAGVLRTRFTDKVKHNNLKKDLVRHINNL